MYANLFYAYLLIGSKIRSELVQTNLRVGFENFKVYQDRKDIFTEKWFSYARVRTAAALQAEIADARVRSLEGRFVPGNTPEKMKNKIKYLMDCASWELNDNEKSKFLPKLHFAPHFVKKQVKPQNPKETESFNFEMTNPRDAKLRTKVRCMTNSIIELREKQPGIMFNITGIDGSSSEIGCRPEVFACDIRRLCSHKQSKINNGGILLPQIRRTYHAGEDFLCLLDGLRAIDESINFFDMTNEDRLGHALALGVDVEEWYANKKGSVILPKQDLLDNIVWMYGKMLDYGMPTYTIEGEVQRVFHRLFTEIYVNHRTFSEFCHIMDINLYYKSWKLRGDDPYLYMNYPQTKGYNKEYMH